MSSEFFPRWVTKNKVMVEKVYQVKAILKELGVNTVCELLKCPNIGECFSKPTISFMILGNICSRNCAYCAIDKGEPKKVDFDEPKNIAKTAKRLGLKHTIITSVSRDDLADGGALHFAHTVHELKLHLPESTIEVLVPDFNGNIKAVKTILGYEPHVFTHNVETVPRIYAKLRTKASYEKSIKILKSAKRLKPEIITKSGLMVGLGETEEEVFQVMKDLRGIKCDILTIGQYLQPTRYNIPVDTLVTPETFMKYKNYGIELGFLHIESAPFVRSSYNTELYISDRLKDENNQNKIGRLKDGKISPYHETAPLRF